MATKNVKSEAPRERPRRLTYKERRELEALPQQIETLEAEQAQLYRTMSDPVLYRQDSQEIVVLQARLATLARELDAAYARWEMLEQLQS